MLSDAFCIAFVLAILLYPVFHTLLPSLFAPALNTCLPICMYTRPDDVAHTRAINNYLDRLYELNRAIIT